MAKEVTIDENKQKALAAAMAQIEKQYGKGSVMKLGDTAHLNVETVPSGSLGLDLALGVGGIPKGRIIEIYGPESGGKTTVALHMVVKGSISFRDTLQLVIKVNHDFTQRHL